MTSAAAGGSAGSSSLAITPVAAGDHLTVPFAWRRDRPAGVLDFVLSDGLVSGLTVIFG
ncbi:MAG TPA: hypothetical protein VF162_11060 [Streptosporangiaceae bacterium]